MTQNHKKKLSKVIKFSKKLLKILCMACIFSMALASQVFAADDPKIVSGTQKLFTYGTTALALLIPAGAGVFLGYHAFQKSVSDDDAVIAHKNKLMKNVLIGAIIAETASGIVAFVLNFYA